MDRIRIATRKSPLAVWQAEHVAKLLVALQPGLEVSLVERSTKGDRILDQALSKIGGKDLFVKEIEAALIEGDAEVAVHSLKDVPTELPEGLVITAFPTREDPRDALVSPAGYTVDSLPQGARVGTSSLRRGAQLMARRPDLNIVPIRGNVQTRLKKLEEENMAATMLAYAGLKRLGLESLASEVLEPEVCLPAIGQGILAVETRSDDAATNALISQLDDPAARTAATVERAFLRRLEGGCQVPIAAHAVVSDDHFEIEGLVASVDGKQVFRSNARGARDEASAVGQALADELLAAGAGPVLEALKAEA